MKLKLLYLLFFLHLSYTYSQHKELSQQTEISVLTIGPGSSLNDAFGHNAFRVRDGIEDVVYDYGRFDFNAPNFYLNFAKGKLDYFMGKSPYNDFKAFYIWQDRSIKEVNLNLNEEQKRQLNNFLVNNLKPENKYYSYDFFYDNCATKIRDVLNDGIGMEVQYKEPSSFEPKSFRKLIQQNLDWNSWGSFGIDIALGSVIDKKASPNEHMFLPEYIHSFFEKASIVSNPEKPLVNTTRDIYKNKNDKISSNFFLSPLFIIGLLSIVIMCLTFNDFKKKKRTMWLDTALFIITGLIGIFLLLLWFGTNHSATAQNYNLLWAFALNIFVVKQVVKTVPRNWFVRYIKFLVIMLCLLLLQWVIGIQGFAYALIPLLLALMIRYIYLIFHFNKRLSN